MIKRTLSVDQFAAELRKYLHDKRKQNPSYSIREQAKLWSIAPSTLQKLFKGERGLGFHIARELANNFNVEVTKKMGPKAPKPPKWKFQALNPESQAQVSWTNLAILEMIKLKDFEPSVEWVADRLGLEIATTEQILKVMEKERMLARDETGWQDLLEDADTESKIFSTEIVRKSLAQLSILSAEKIRTVEFKNREHAFQLFPMSLKEMEAMKAKIFAFRSSLSQTAQKSRGSKDEVYCLNIGLFPVTQTKLESYR